MAYGVDKQPSSRPVGATGYQVLQCTSVTLWSTKFGSATNQIRVCSQINGWGSINNTTADSIVPTSAGGVGMVITGGTTSANPTVYTAPTAEYFTVSPGQIFMFSTTSTSSGAISVTEMT